MGFVTTLVALPAASAYAQAPANDAFAAPLELTSATLTGSTAEATAEPGEPAHSGPARHSVWFSFTAPEDRRVTIDSCGSGFDTVLAVYEGDSLPALRGVAADDDGCGLGSRVVFDAHAGATYRIALDGYKGEIGDYALHLDARVGNDDADNPREISDGEPATGDTGGATAQPGERDHAGSPAAHSVWFSAYADPGTPVVVQTCGSAFPTRLSAYGGDGTAPALAESAQQSCGDGRLGTVVRFTADEDGYARIALDGVDGASGAYTIAVTTSDDRAHPYRLGQGERLTVSNAGATHEPGEPAHAGDAGGASLWFGLSMPATGRTIVVDTCGTAFGGLDTVLAAYLEHDGALTPLAANDDTIGCGAGGTGSRISFVAPAGDIRIAVDGKAGATGEFTVFAAAAPANDDVAQAQLLSGTAGSWDGDTTLGTAEVDEAAHGGSPAAHSVWYRWRPATNTPIDLDVCGDGFAALAGVYTRDAGGLEPLAGAAPAAGCSADEPGIRFDATAGTEYLIAVDGGEGRFTLSLARPPANDDLAHAQDFDGWVGSATTGGASAEQGEPAHAGLPATRSVWYRYEAPAGATGFTLNACPPAPIVSFMRTSAGPPEHPPLQVAVYRGTTLSGLTLVGSAGPASDCAAVKVPLGAQDGRSFLIAVDSRRASDFDLFSDVIAPPENDDRAHAFPLDTVSDGSTDSATHEPGEPDHAGAGGSTSVWYRWRPAGSGPAQVDVCDPRYDSGDDAVVAVYTLDGDTLVPAGRRASGPGCGEARRVDLDAEAGQTYWVAVDTRPGGDPWYRLRAAMRPGNDDEAHAQPIGADAYTIQTDLATREAGEPEHAGVAGAPSVWYRWTPGDRGTVTLDTCASDYKVDPILAVYTTGEDGLEPVTAADDTPGCGSTDRGARVSFQPQAGVEYLVAVAAHPGRTGQVTLSLPPANDSFSGAVAERWESFGEWADLTRAGAEPGEPAHGGAPAQHSLWYAWTPPRTARATVDTCGSGARLGVYTGTSLDALTPVAATAAECPSGDGQRLRFDVQQGATYRIALDGDGPYASFGARLAVVNDRLDGATSLYSPSGFSLSGDTGEAGREPGEPYHAGAGGTASLWYSFVGQYTGNAHLDTCNGSSFDTALAVYRQTGSGMSGLEEVASADDSAGCGDGTASRVRFKVSEGVRYYVAVDGHGGATGSFHLEFALAPANDSFASATPISPGETGGTLDDSGREPGEPDHGHPDAPSTVWYGWTAPHGAMAHVDVCPRDGAAGTEAVTVYRQDGTAFGDLVRVGDTADASCGTGRRVRWRAEADTQYRFVVTGAEGEEFLLDLVDGPVNDDFAHASPLSAGTVRTSTREATSEPGEPAHGAAGGASVWYRYTATRTGPLVLSTCGSDFDTLLAVYDDTASFAALHRLAADDDGERCGAGNSRLSVDLTAGKTYLIAVDGKDGAAGSLSLAVDPPANDRVAGAATLTGRPAYAAGTTLGATAEQDEPGGVTQGSVWWRWTAPETRTVDVSSCGSANGQADVGIYEGSGLQETGWIWAVCNGGFRYTLDATQGETYFFQVYGQTGDVQLHIDAPDNDDMGPATELTLSDDDSVETDGSLAGAGYEPGEDSHGGAAPIRSVWFSWTSPVGAPVEVSTCGSATPVVLEPYASAFAWWDMAPQSATVTQCAGGQRQTFTAEAGRQYRFAVAAAGPEAGAFHLRIDQAQDTTPPHTLITSGPGQLTNAPIPSLFFSADEPATFECSVDGATPAACASPLRPPDLPDGDHQVSVRATDHAGNREPQPVTYAFRLDRAPPDTTLTGAVHGAPVHGLPPWQLSADGPVDHYECAIDGNSVGCGSVAVGALALGTHQLTARAVDRAGNVDPTPATDTFELVDSGPAASLALDNASGPASLEVALGITASDPEGDPLYYAIDWGDGKAIGENGGLPTSPRSHIYTRAGVYTISVTVSDPWRDTVATGTVEVAPGEPLDARAGDDIVADQDEPVTFDGGDSRPLKGIERYEWSFGDGTPHQTGRTVTHKYTAGSYTATLEVTLDGNTRSDDVHVEVKPPAPGGLVLHVTSHGAPLAGADLQIVDADGARHSAVSDSRGEARLRGLPDGDYTIFADRAGYRPTTAQATLSGGDGGATIAMTEGEVAVAQLTSTPLTEAEAIARGVDPSAASSYASFDFSANIVLVGDENGGGGSVPISGTINNGNFYGTTIGGGGGSGGGGCSGAACNWTGSNGSVSVTGAVVDGRPIIATMVVPLGAGSFMKEFFDVSMTVSNLAPDGFTLRGGRTALELPSGLSLAQTSSPQSASAGVADIPGGGSRSMSWTVQGDTAGEYPLTASYTATLDPSGRPVTIHAQTSRPLKVWGSTAVEPVVEVDDQAGEDHPFQVRVGVHNTATVPVYNTTISLRSEGRAHYLEQPEQKDQFTFASVPAGETAWSDTIVLIPDATGDVDLTRSVVRKVAGDSSDDTKITSHPRGVPFEEDPDFEATPMQDRIALYWDRVPGAKGYRIYRTSTDRETPFPGTPIATTSSAKATIHVPHTDPAQLYAVSAIVDGRPSLRHPVIEAKSAAKDPDDDDGDDGDGPGNEDPNGPPDATCENDLAHGVANQLHVGPVLLYTSCFKEVSPGVWEGEVGGLGRVRAAGIDVTPTASAKVRVDLPKLTLSVEDATVEVGNWELYHGSVSWDFAKPIKAELGKDAKFKGLPAKGSVELDFDLEHATLTATAGLPKNFGGVTGTLKLGATEKDGLVLGEVSIDVKQAPIGKLGLKDLDLKYSKEDGADRWAGSAGIMLPAKAFAASISGSVSWLDGSFEKASVGVDGLNEPFGETGIFLQRIGISVTLQPDLALGGSMGVSAGPQVDGKEALSVDGEVSVSFGDPITYDLSGTLKVVEAEMASGHLRYAMPDAVDVDGELDFEKEILGATLGIKASVNGWVEGTRAFNIEGSATVSGPGFSEGGDAVLSSVGVAACRHGWGPDVGAGYKWSGEAHWFASSCGLGDFEARRSARSAKAAAAEDRGPLVVAPDTRIAVFAVAGDSAAPKVTVTGPAGEAVATPAGDAAVSTPRFFLMQDPGNRTTYVAVEQPSAGTWDIRTQPGSAAITGIQQATSLPPVDVTGEVHGSGAARELTWSLTPIPGQEVTFVAEGAGTRRLIGTTSAATGTFGFTPEPGPGGRRVVRAYVSQDGLPRETVDVAAFDVADPPLVPPAGLKLERQGDGVAGSWDASPDADGYRATVDVGDGRRLSFDLGAGERSVTVPGVAAGDTVTLEVAARTPSGSFGPSAVTQLDGSGAPPTVTIAQPAEITSGDTVDLRATAAAGDDPVAAIAWELDGDGLYDDASDAAVTQRFEHPGRYPVGVRVTDTAGRVALATATVTVDGRAPHAAIAAGGPAPLAGETVSFTADDSDPDGSVLSRAWDLDDDGQFDEAQGAAASTVFAAGRHSVRYRVVDDSGQVATAERTLDVAANRAPELSIAPAPDAPAAGETVRLTATARDPEDRGLEAVAWDLDGDGRFTDGTGLSVEHAFPAGTTTVRARVADSGGAVTTAERTVTVAGSAQAPPPPASTPTPPATTNPATPPARALGGLTAPKSVRRAALLKSGLAVTFRDLLAGARLDVTLRFVPSHGRAVTLAHVRTTAGKAGTLVRKLSVTRAGRRALRPGARGRLELAVAARSGADPAVRITRRIGYRP